MACIQQIEVQMEIGMEINSSEVFKFKCNSNCSCDF